MASTKVFIVTGASKGLGAAIAKYLLGQSHKVVATARSADLLESLKRAHPGQVEYVAGDMTDPKVCITNDATSIYFTSTAMLSEFTIDAREPDRIGHQVFWSARRARHQSRPTSV